MSTQAARQAVICEPLRTPVGRFGGIFRDIDAATLAATVIRELVSRTGLRGEDVDDVVMGQCSPNGEGPADRGARVADRSPLWLGAAGRHQRLHAGPDGSL
jgi:acetyl-CoA C-acetyltransferase